MATNPFSLTITGNPKTAAVTEINVRSGPGKSNDTLFTAKVGTANLAVQEVRADDKGITQDNKVYQWLKATFPNGKQGWMRDDLVNVVGDGTAFGYGVVAQPTNAFSLTRATSVKIPVTVASPSTTVTTPAPASAST